MQPQPSIPDRHPVSTVPQAARAYQGRTAGVVTRTIAAAVDALVVLLVVVSGYAGLNGLLFLISPRDFRFLDAGLLLSLTAAWVVALLYLTGCWWLTGRTYGCHLMGLRVVGRRGGRLRWWTAFVRALCATLVPIGLLWCAVSPRTRSLQDLVAGTHVIYEWQPHRLAAAGEQSSPLDDASLPVGDDGDEGGHERGLSHV